MSTTSVQSQQFQARTGITIEDAYLKFHPKLSRYFNQRFQDYSLSEDIASEAIMVAFEKIELYRNQDKAGTPGKGNLMGWIAQIGLNLFRSKYYKKERFGGKLINADEGVELEVLGHQHSTRLYYEHLEETDLAERQQRQVKRIREVINKLPLKQRVIFRDKVELDKSVEQISESYQLNENTVKTSLARTYKEVLAVIKNEADD